LQPKDYPISTQLKFLNLPPELVTRYMALALEGKLTEEVLTWHTWKHGTAPAEAERATRHPETKELRVQNTLLTGFFNDLSR
jgi:hypothetical protein